jgi:hypothetical protein
LKPRRLAAAALALAGSNAALAEPYSGDPTADPLVRLVSWTLLLLGCLAFSFLVAAVASRGKWRSRRFAWVMPASFLAVLGLALLVGALRVIAEIVSLILHLVL